MRKSLIKATSALMVTAVSLMQLSFASAAFIEVRNTQSSIKSSTLTNHEITFSNQSVISAGQTIVITLASSSIPVALDFTDIDVLIDSTQQAVAATNGAATWGAVRTSGTVITLTAPSSGSVPALSTIAIRIGTNATNGATGDQQITNPTATGTAYLVLSGADSGSAAMPIVSNDTITISAVVPQTISFTLSTTTAYFGNLTSASAKFASSTNTSGSTAVSAAHTVVVATNAAFGYVLTLQGGTLTNVASSTQTISAIGNTAAASTPGTEQFGMYATVSGGTGGTVATRYATVGSYAFGASTSTADTVASGAVPTAATTYSMNYVANIASLTEAGTYQTNLTYVVTGNF